MTYDGPSYKLIRRLLQISAEVVEQNDLSESLALVIVAGFQFEFH